MSSNETLQAIGSIILIVGAIVGLFGFKIYVIILSITGFILGGLIGLILFGVSSQDAGAALIGAIICAFVGAWLLPKIERIAIAFSAGIIGLLISITLLLGDRSAYIYNTNMMHYVLNNPINLFMFIIFAIFGWILYKWAIILITAGDGASLMALGGSLLNLWDPQFYSAAFIGALVLGVATQAYQEKNTLKNTIPPSLSGILYAQVKADSQQKPSADVKISLPYQKPIDSLQQEHEPIIVNPIQRDQEPIIVTPIQHKQGQIQRPLPNLRLPQNYLKGMCVNCGHVNQDTAKYCNKCGSNIGTISNVCSFCGYYNRSQARYCSRCGREINDIKSADYTSVW